VWLGDLPVAVLSIGPPSYIAPDHLGAPHEITNASKRVEWQWDHDPFGNGLPTGSYSYNLRFRGQSFGGIAFFGRGPPIPPRRSRLFSGNESSDGASRR
jgi:hypothetical protein